MNPQPLNLSNAVDAARALLGWKLVHETRESLTSGYITETEAYTGGDPASHTFRGQTPRNTPMFGPAGTIYVYFTYGMHYCFNIVTGPAGRGEAVLIRTLQPVAGIELMKKRRKMTDVSKLTDGPAKLVQAMGITKELNGRMLGEKGLYLERGFRPLSVRTTKRIGIRQGADLLRRFVVVGVSG